jgi:acetaldehyde dehydrogenase (acetylating)
VVDTRSKVAILGTGNIGCDLLVKVMRSEHLVCTLFAGRNLRSDGMQFASDKGIRVSERSIEAIQEKPGCCDIVFDATTASSHLVHAPILKQLGKYAIDLTPSQVGKMCIPSLNLHECLNGDNVNLITCGGQATIPILRAVTNLYPTIKYVELVASISSKSAGPGTRQNIDEFTQTTRHAMETFCPGVTAKAIIVLNPAEPPIMMHNTIYFQVDNPNLDYVKQVVDMTVLGIQKYVPGYHIKCGPSYHNGILALMVEVIGQGDYLPAYAGNLDIITCAAIELAETKAYFRGLL